MSLGRTVRPGLGTMVIVVVVLVWATTAPVSAGLNQDAGSAKTVVTQDFFSTNPSEDMAPIPGDATLIGVCYDEDEMPIKDSSDQDLRFEIIAKAIDGILDEAGHEEGPNLTGVENREELRKEVQRFRKEMREEVRKHVRNGNRKKARQKAKAAKAANEVINEVSSQLRDSILFDNTKKYNGMSLPVYLDGNLYFVTVFPCEEEGEEEDGGSDGDGGDDEKDTDEVGLTQHHEYGHSLAGAYLWKYLECVEKHHDYTWDNQDRKEKMEELRDKANSKYHDKVGEDPAEAEERDVRDNQGHTEAAKEAARETLRQEFPSVNLENCFDDGLFTVIEEGGSHDHGYSVGSVDRRSEGYGNNDRATLREKVTSTHSDGYERGFRSHPDELADGRRDATSNRVSGTDAMDSSDISDPVTDFDGGVGDEGTGSSERYESKTRREDDDKKNDATQKDETEGEKDNRNTEARTLSSRTNPSSISEEPRIKRSGGRGTR